MDTTRWKSILVPRPVYEEIKAMARSEGRTIGGQLRVVFEKYVEREGHRENRFSYSLHSAPRDTSKLD